MVSRDLQSHQQVAAHQEDFSVSREEEGEIELEDSMDAVKKESGGSSGSSTECGSVGLTCTNGETNTGTENISLVKVGLRRSGSIKDLIQKFSNGEIGQPFSAGSSSRSSTAGAIMSKSDRDEPEEQRLPTITVTPPSEHLLSNQSATQESDLEYSKSSTDATSESITAVAEDQMVVESDFDPKKVPGSPLSEGEAPNPQVRQNPKYQLSLSSDMLGKHSKDADRKSGDDCDSLCSESHNSKRRPSHHGSTESLASQDWDLMSDRMSVTDSPCRVFRSPYKALSTESYRVYRMSESKTVVLPATSDVTIFSHRSASPVPSPTVLTPRLDYTIYSTLPRRRGVIPSGVSLNPGVHSKRNYITELTGQLEECQRRNRFLEAESVQMEKERTQLRFEMRGLLVQKEDLLQTNAQLQLEMKGMGERMAELERERAVMNNSFRQLETELMQAKEVMVEASTQQYAFNYLQKSLKNKIQDTEDTLEKQTQDSRSLSEKLWHAERKLEELNMDKQAQEKKAMEMSSAVQHLEAELGAALQTSSQATAELALQRELRADAQHRLEELEDSLMERTQELQKAQQTAARLQGEVCEKLSDKEEALEGEIKWRERLQLQCRKAERKVKDLQAELQTLTQSKEDLLKQLKQAQENILDLENNVEDMHDSEQRWANKHKKAIEQVEQLQHKLIQEKDLNDQLSCEKGRLERQVRDLHEEVQVLKENRVREDTVTKAELKIKELEESLQAVERSKTVLVNTIGKLERKIKQLSDQTEEEHQATTQQIAQMTQRIRSLKRALNEAEEEASRREAQQRQTQRELDEERETSARLQRQLLDLHQQTKQKESLTMRKTLTNQKRMISC